MFFTPGEVVASELTDRTAVVIDVLRATSSIVEALGSGAKSLFPVVSIEEALRLANTLGREEVLLAGERKSLPVEGFDLGNSPAEFTPERVGGRTLVMSTTNGTAAMALAAPAQKVIIASWLNLSAVVNELVRTAAQPVLLCSGRERQFSLDDAVFAGRLVAELIRSVPGAVWRMNDAALAALELSGTFNDPETLFPSTAAGQQIIAAGLRDDLAFCGQVDRHDIVPVLLDRQVTLPTSGTAASEG